jgi:plasmid stability protein
LTDLLIREIDPELKEALKERARAHGRSLSDEVKAVLDDALRRPEPPKKMGTWMASLVRPEDRGDDLVFEIPGDIGEPPNFE